MKLLNTNTQEASLLLRELTGEIVLQPIKIKDEKPFYMAQCDILCTAILDEKDKSSFWYMQGAPMISNS